VTVEKAISHLETVSEVMRHLVGVHCGHCADEMGNYTDGRRVTGHINFLEGTQFVQIGSFSSSAAYPTIYGSRPKKAVPAVPLVPPNLPRPPLPGANKRALPPFPPLLGRARAPVTNG
jgi:hypothetical protein